MKIPRLDIKKIALAGVLVLLLLLIRGFESKLFYDPFTSFFKGDYLSSDVPDFSLGKLLANTTLRYILNSLISLGILYVFFPKKGVLKFSTIFFSVLFVILIILYAILSVNLTQELHLFFFYVRRFLIQPIFLLLLLPAFYYQKYHSKN